MTACERCGEAADFGHSGWLGQVVCHDCLAQAHNDASPPRGSIEAEAEKVLADPEPHPLAAVFPAMPDEEFESLVRDIAENGLNERIVLFEGKVLDGRHRLDACRCAGVDPVFRQFQGSDALAYVLSANLHRRHLNEAQRAAIAVGLLPEYERRAKERMAEGGRGGTSATPSKARDQAAEAVGVSGRSVQDAKLVAEESPDQMPELLSGRISIAKAKKAVELKRLCGQAPDLHARVENAELALSEAKQQLSWRREAERADTPPPDTAPEGLELRRCASTIGRDLNAFIRVVEALARIRQARLYETAGQETLAGWCRHQFGLDLEHIREVLGVDPGDKRAAEASKAPAPHSAVPPADPEARATDRPDCGDGPGHPGPLLGRPHKRTA